MFTSMLGLFSRIRTADEEETPKTAPSGLLKFILKFSSGSKTRSPSKATVTVLLASPDAKDIVPCVAEKSAPATAEPL